MFFLLFFFYCDSIWNDCHMLARRANLDLSSGVQLLRLLMEFRNEFRLIVRLSGCGFLLAPPLSKCQSVSYILVKFIHPPYARPPQRARSSPTFSRDLNEKDLTWIMSSYSSKRNQIYPTRYDRRRCHALFICHFFWFINYGDNTVSDLVLFCTGASWYFPTAFLLYIFFYGA